MRVFGFMEIIMKNKIFKINFGFVLFVIFIFIFWGRQQKTLAEFLPEKICPAHKENKSIGMANPAAVYCTDLGYEYKVVNDPSGQKGMCTFPDKSECDAWKFLAGQCGQEYSYCAQQGYDTITKHDGKNALSRDYAVCVTKMGVEIGAVTTLTDLSEKSTIGSVRLENHEQEHNPEALPKDTLPITPPSFDWRNHNGSNWMTSVKDQAGCGSCWAFAAVGSVEAVNNIHLNNPNSDIDLSEQYLVSDCFDSGSCAGGSIRESLHYIGANGVPDEGCFPYIASDAECSERCPDWESRLTSIVTTGRVPNDQEAIKQRLILHGPLAASVYTSEGGGFGGMGYFDSNNIYRCSNEPEDPYTNHVVVIVGYNDNSEYWIVKNSWGSSWGEEGYFKVGYGECFIESWVFYADMAMPECGDVITANTYLSSDIVDCPEHGLIIDADNIDLDCKGHTISGLGTPFSYGVDITEKEWSDVMRCNITNFYSGIKLKDEDYCKIKNSYIYNNFIGIDSSLSWNTEIINNLVLDNEIGIYIKGDGPRHPKLFDNIACNNFSQDLECRDNYYPYPSFITGNNRFHKVARCGGVIYSDCNPLVPQEFPTIQAAIDDACCEGIQILVSPGTYQPIDFKGKAVTVKSLDGPATTIIDGSQSGSAVTFESGEGPDSVLDGFTITGGHDNMGGGILCVGAATTPTIKNSFIIGNSADSNGGGISAYYASPTIINTVIADNSAQFGAGIDLVSSSASIINSTITGNSAVYSGGGIYSGAPSSPEITNTIIWGNTAGYEEPGLYAEYPYPTISYSDIQGGCSYCPGERNINSNPLFVNASDNNYRLGSRSPCIDRANADAAPDLDIDGNSRYDDRGVSNKGTGEINYVDIGAFEKQTDSEGIRRGKLRELLLPEQ
ncbi:MAG: C1 family peptidase [bacterium]